MYDQNKCSSQCSCNQGIRDSLKAILDCVQKTGNVPGFGVDVVITLKNGESHTISVNSGTLNSIVISEKLVVAGNLTLSICEISKIKILTSKISNPEFMSCLNIHIQNITVKDTQCNNNYYAITIDDDSDDNDDENLWEGEGMTRGYSNGCNNGCNQGCNNGCNNRCNCNMPKPPTPQDCSCTDALKGQICVNKDKIDKVGSNGEHVKIKEVDSITTSTVLKDFTVIEDKIDVVSAVNLGTVDVNMSNLITLNPELMVSNVYFDSPTTVVSDVNPTTTTVIEDVLYDVTDVVNDVVLENISPIIDIQKATADIFTIQGVNPLPIVNSLTTRDRLVAEGIEVQRADAIAELPNVQLGSTIDYNNIIEMETTTELVGLYSTALDDPFNYGSPLEVVIPANSFGAGIPPVDVTLPTSIAGLPVTFDSGFYGLPDFGTVVSYNPDDLPLNVVTDLGEAQYGTFLTSAVPTPTTIKEVNTTTAGIVNNIVGGNNTTILTDITWDKYQTQGVVSVDATSLNIATENLYVDVVGNVDYTEIDISEELNVDTKTISEVASITPTTLVSQVTTNITPTVVVADLSVGKEFISTVQNVTTKEVEVVTTNQRSIEGKVVYVGCGIMAVNEYSGDMSIYSLCDINSFITK